ncbi:UNVERIFIED_CONTAM: hypothetical protein Sradi_6871900 [Sesamum radiatum]|uniref:Uncharacterized protein n=1 Tax=Sesamum radiatum TaxID=300843 RepID=A0AAW2JK88_SESRA
MEEGNVIRPSPLRPVGGSLKSPSSGRSSPKGSPSFRRLNSGRTPRRESRTGGIGSQCFRSNRIVLWLLLITLWAYAGFYFQSRWAHGDNKEDLFSGGYGGESSGGNSEPQLNKRRDLIANVDSGAIELQSDANQSSLKNMDVVLMKNGSGVSLNKNTSPKKKSKRSGRGSRKKSRGKPKVVTEDVESEVDIQEEEIPKQNTTYGFLVGPFGSVEDKILEWSPEKRSVIVLNKKGGLMPELARRKIKVLEDKTDLSFKTAMKADLIIAGSAVCSSWIGENSTIFLMACP